MVKSNLVNIHNFLCKTEKKHYIATIPSILLLNIVVSLRVFLFFLPEIVVVVVETHSLLILCK